MDAVSEIKGKLDLVEYIGRVTRLQKAGKNFRGLCPFHTEKTPSFYVFPDRGNWRCFGSCGEGGDLFSFVQKRENLDFRGTLQLLAREAGVELTPQSGEKRGRDERLMAVMSAAVDFYQRELQEEGGAAAREYVHGQRGISQRAVDAFRIGWAPESWRTLRDYLSGRGYSDRDMLAAGLLVDPENGREPYDRFRGRVIIPIADERGQYVAMGGRGMHGEEPKYLNSPQTEIFDKGHTLFGLHLASAAIRASGAAVVVEGYMDVIGPWQAGFENVVATMGTSLTEHHAALLKRSAKRVVLAMDPDAAGMAAAERAGTLFLGFGSPEAMARSVRSAEDLAGGAALELRVAPLPGGKDPDEIARENPEGWQRAIAEAPPYAEFLLQRLLGDVHSPSPTEARAAVDRLRPVLLAVRDPIERGMYVQRIARQLGVAEAAILERIKPPTAPRGRPREQASPGAPASPEDTLLAFLLRWPDLRADYARILPPKFFSDSLNREVFLRWRSSEATAPESTPEVLAREEQLLARRLPDFSLEVAQKATRELIERIRRENLESHHSATTAHLGELEQELGVKALAALAKDAWSGLPPAPGSEQASELALEDLQLGLSIHRREDTA